MQLGQPRWRTRSLSFMSANCLAVPDAECGNHICKLVATTRSRRLISRSKVRRRIPRGLLPWPLWIPGSHLSRPQTHFPTAWPEQLHSRGGSGK